MRSVRGYWCYFKNRAKNTRRPNRKSGFQPFN